MNQDFPHELVKGKIAELIFELMFRETKKFTTLRFGYEYTLPELAQYRNLVEVQKVLDNISNAPDFILISSNKNENGKLQVFTVEVKYRSRPDSVELKQIAKKTLQTWNPSWLFVATPDGFYFAPCKSVFENEGMVGRLSENWVSGNLQTKYLELLRDFEINH